VSRTLVTGAAGDLGGAIATLLAARGDDLVLLDHPAAEERLAAAALACRGGGARVEIMAVDVVDAAAVEQAITGAGPVSGIVSAAGYQGVFAPLDRYPLDDARRVLEVNVLGLLHVAAAGGRAMAAAGAGGSIVNIASMAGVSGAPNMPAYSASKAAVIGFTKSAAKDLAPAGIRVNAVSPAFIGPGRMWDNQVAGQAAVGSQYYAPEAAAVAEQMIGLIPLRRVGTVEEVARVVAFLLSDDASYLTGVNIEISGGSV
jgi:NAD(P)-dependent dehydrogenase (short-subunit alcohol dehydrogenase family)